MTKIYGVGILLNLPPLLCVTPWKYHRHLNTRYLRKHSNVPLEVILDIKISPKHVDMTYEDKTLNRQWKENLQY